MADTDINLSVDLDVQDAEKTAQQLQKEIQHIFSTKGQKSAAVTNLEIQLKKLQQRSSEVREAMADMLNVQSGYRELTDELSDLIAKEQQLQSALDSIEGKGILTPEEEERAERLGEELDRVRDAMSGLVAPMEELEQVQIPTEEFTRLREEYEQLNQELSGEQVGSERWNELSQAIEEVWNKIQQLRASGGAMVDVKELGDYQELSQQLDSLNDKQKALIVRYSEISSSGRRAFSGLSSVVTGLKNTFTKTVSLVKKFASHLSLSRRHSDGLSGSLKRGIRTILKYGLGIRSLYALFNKLRQALKEGFENLSNSNAGFKASVDSLKGSLTTFKNSIASAFKPIVDMALPYIQQLVEWMTNLMDRAAQFTAAIAGQKTYAKAIKQTGQAAEDAKRQLSGLDNLNVLNPEQNQGSMFEEVNIDPVVIERAKELRNLLIEITGLSETLGSTIGNLGSELLKKVKSLLGGLNFGSVGEAIAGALNGFLNTDFLKSVGDLFSDLIDKAAEFVAGFTDKFSGASLGISLGEMLNEALKVDWATIETATKGIARELARTLNGFLATTSWSDLASTISTGIETALDGASTFIENFDSTNLADAIVDFLTNIDWVGILGRAFVLIIQSFGSLTQFIGQLIVRAAEEGAKLGVDVAQFFNPEQISEELATTLKEEVIPKVIDDVGEAAQKGLHDFWYDDIVNPLKKLFGIPVKDTEEAGEQIGQGLENGIEDKLNSSKSVFEQALKGGIIFPVTKLFGIHSPSTLFYEYGEMIIAGLKNGISDKISTVVETFTSLKTKLKSPMNAILGAFEGLVNGVIRAVNKMIDALNSVSFSVPSWVPGLGGKSFGFSLPRLQEVSIPRLAQGAVIPPNKEFMAVLGDQTSGTNIEAPVDTIKQALAEVLANFSGNSNQEIVLNLDGREFLRAMVKNNNDYKKQHNGISALA